MPWKATRALFPVTESLVYLNHAGVAPISTRVRDALARYADVVCREGAYNYAKAYTPELDRVRSRAAEFLGAKTNEVAFVANTSEGLSCVANGIDWHAGDRVVTCDLEFPSNIYPWWNLKRLGVETILLESEAGRLPIEKVETALADPKVRLLSLSSVEYGSGARNDVDTIGRLCRERDVLFCVDAIQSLGCLPLDVRETPIDFLAADGHKWMLGLEGCGLFYCAAERLPLLRPSTVGWSSVANSLDFDHYALEFPESAAKFEAGTPNIGGIFGLGAALDLLLELGTDAIGKRVLGLTDRLVKGLREQGAEIHSPRSATEASGIVSFVLPKEAPEITCARLRRAKIFTTVRRGGLRVSPHFYNDEGDIDALLEALRS